MRCPAPTPSAVDPWLMTADAPPLTADASARFRCHMAPPGPVNLLSLTMLVDLASPERP
jgi:hypothetical protein